MDHVRLALIGALLCGASYGCATPADEAGATAPAVGTQAPAPLHRETSYRTGSRLPPLDSSDGTQSSGTASRDDYQDAARQVLNPSSAR